MRLFLILILTTLSYSQETISLYLGHHYQLDKNKSSAKFDEVDPSGIQFGLMIPIHVEFAEIDFKMKAAFHDSRDVLNNDSKNSYLSATNEFLIGKSYQLENNLEVVPQIGFGMMLETIFGEFGDGIVYDQVFIDLSVQILLSNDNYKYGLMINLENGIYASHDNYIANHRLNSSFIIKF